MDLAPNWDDLAADARALRAGRPGTRSFTLCPECARPLAVTINGYICLECWLMAALDLERAPAADLLSAWRDVLDEPFWPSRTLVLVPRSGGLRPRRPFRMTAWHLAAVRETRYRECYRRDCLFEVLRERRI